MERTEIAPVAGDEAGTHRLHLAATGLIVGEAFGEGNHSILIEAVPASPAAGTPLPTAGDLGLDESYRDCTDCPHAFTVTPDGRTIMWINSAGGMIVAVSLDQPVCDVEPARRGARRSGDRRSTSTMPVRSSRSPVIPRRRPWSCRSAAASTTTLEGVVGDEATAERGDRAAAASERRRRPPASTTTTTAPAAPAGVMLATAGDDGVAVIENGIEIRRLDQPAEIALLTPGGAVIFQPQRPAPDGTPGDPLIWRPDGTVEPLLGPLAGQPVVPPPRPGRRSTACRPCCTAWPHEGASPRATRRSSTP